MTPSSLTNPGLAPPWEVSFNMNHESINLTCHQNPQSLKSLKKNRKITTYITPNGNLYPLETQLKNPVIYNPLKKTEPTHGVFVAHVSSSVLNKESSNGAGLSWAKPGQLAAPKDTNHSNILGQAEL